MTRNVEPLVGNRFLEQPVVVSGDEPRLPVAVPTERQQCFVGSRCIRRSESRRENLRQTLAHDVAPADHLFFQEAERPVKLFGL